MQRSDLPQCLLGDHNGALIHLAVRAYWAGEYDVEFPRRSVQ